MSGKRFPELKLFQNDSPSTVFRELGVQSVITRFVSNLRFPELMAGTRGNISQLTIPRVHT